MLLLLLILEDLKEKYEAKLNESKLQFQEKETSCIRRIDSFLSGNRSTDHDLKKEREREEEREREKKPRASRLISYTSVQFEQKDKFIANLSDRLDTYV